MSAAVGRAIAALVGEDADILDEAIAFAEEARTSLVMDNAMLAASIMFAQPLLKIWKPHWRFAYAIGISLGSKWVTEGFYLGDVVDQLIPGELNLAMMREGEAAAVDLMCWTDLGSRLRSFRNALHQVAQSEPLQLNEPSAASIRVLIVDPSTNACETYREMILACQPAARVHVAHSVAHAVTHKRTADSAGEQIELVIVALQLAADDEEYAADAHGRLQRVLAGPNAFHVAAAMDGPAAWQAVDAGTPPPRTDFLFKPFVAVVSEQAETIHEHAALSEWHRSDGSINGCDAVLQAPLPLRAMRTLLECSEV